MQRAQLTEMYWICAGMCRVVGSIPFMTKRTYMGRKIVSLMRECVENEKAGTLSPLKLEDDEKYTPQQLTIHSLDEGSSFPSIPNLEGHDQVYIL